VQVRYSDLDLSRPDDAMRLYRRIKSAARRACGEADPRNLSAHMQYEECYGRAVENAVEKVHSNTLTALHRSRTQHSVHG
jgi:UrcA family protein